MAARKVRDKARKIAAHLLEASENDLVWEPGRFSVKGASAKFKTIQEIAFAAYTNHPQGMEAGLGAVSYYDPPRSEEHTSELQSRSDLVCRLLLGKKKK